jgi:hypothetical protein
MGVQPVITVCFTNAGNIFFQIGMNTLLSIGSLFILTALQGNQCISQQVCLEINTFHDFELVTFI